MNRSMFRLLVAAVCLSMLPFLMGDELKRVIDVDVREPAIWKHMPLSDRVLTTPGLKQIRLANGSCLLFCITWTSNKGDSALKRMNMMTICRNKALSEVQKSKSCTVHSVRTLTRGSVEVSDGTTTHYSDVSKLLHCTAVEVHGRVRSWPVIATWFSKDKTVFFLATGGLFDKDMRLIPISAH